MFNLIIKDIRNTINKRVILSYLLYMPMMIYVFSDNYMKAVDAIFFIGTMFIISGGMTSFLQDEKDRWDVVVNSLPIKRSKVVFSKYLGMIINVVLYLVFVSIFMTLGNSTKIININLFNKRALMSILNMLSIILIFTAGVFPIYFKYGVLKLKGLNILIVIILFAIIGGSGFLYSASDVISMSKVLIVNLICVFIFIISSLVSIKIYTNKDIE